MFGYIYETTNLINGKKYIGKHKSVSFDKEYIGSGVALNKDVEKYGKDNFSVKILEEVNTNQRDLDIKENEFIVLFNAVISNKYYNNSYGGENEGWSGINNAAKDNKELDYRMRHNWSHQATGKIWIYKDDVRKYIFPEELNKFLEDGWTKGRPSYIISKGNKNRDLTNSKFNNKVRCLLEHNSIKMEFDSVYKLYDFCKKEYNLSCGTVKHLLNTELEFIPFYNRLQKAKGLKLKRLRR